MSKKTLLLLGIVGFILIFILCVLLHLRSIEKDIANCSNSLLDKNNLASLTADTHDKGRDILITGVVTSEAEKQRALNLLKDQCHMTGLSNNIKVIIPKPKIEPYISINNKLGNVSVNGLLSNKTNINQFLSMIGPSNNSIKHSKDVTVNGFNKHLESIIPALETIGNYSIEIKPKQITLNGIVSQDSIKQSISARITKLLGNKVKVINQLIVIAPKPVVQVQTYIPLRADDCQKQLTKLLDNSMVQFNSGSAEIKQESNSLLNELANTSKSCEGVQIEVVGHTDSSGIEADNIVLSKKRALAVVSYLFTVEVAKEKIKAFGAGSSQPIATNDKAEGRSKNRRIEFKVKSIQE